MRVTVGRGLSVVTDTTWCVEKKKSNFVFEDLYMVVPSTLNRAPGGSSFGLRLASQINECVYQRVSEFDCLLAVDVLSGGEWCSSQTRTALRFQGNLSSVWRRTLKDRKNCLPISVAFF
jgi:hypothetical protein